MKNQLFAHAAGSSLVSSLIGLAERIAYAPSDRLRVLTYHRVDVPGARPWLNPSLLSATPPTFDEQMQFVAARYQPGHGSAGVGLLP